MKNKKPFLVYIIGTWLSVIILFTLIIFIIGSLLKWMERSDVFDLNNTLNSMLYNLFSNPIPVIIVGVLVYILATFFILRKLETE